MLPITHDIDEAHDIHYIILKQAIDKNEVLVKFMDAAKGMFARMQALEASYTVNSWGQAFEHPENDILGDENKELLKQVLA
jgi:hypothetical protein